MKDEKALALVGEDALRCELGVKLVTHALPKWRVAFQPIDAQGATKLVKEIPRYAESARFGAPLLCIADSDQQCPIEWVNANLSPKHRHSRFMLRLAVPEAEAWVLADHDGMARHFKAPIRKLPAVADSLADPKHELMRLVQKHAPAYIRREMIAIAKTGELRRAAGYNAHLRQFASQMWSPERAAPQSASLDRTLSRLRMWQDTMLRPVSP